MDDQARRFRKDIGIGIGLTLLFHIVLLSVGGVLMSLLSGWPLLAGFLPLLGLGVGVIYIIQVVQYAREKGRKGLIVGLILAYAIPFLLVAACTGIVMLMFAAKR